LDIANLQLLIAFVIPLTVLRTNLKHRNIVETCTIDADHTCKCGKYKRFDMQVCGECSYKQRREVRNAESIR
jgi:hypothetical protein